MSDAIPVTLSYVTLDGIVALTRESVIGALEGLSKLAMPPETRDQILVLALHIAKWTKP